MGTKHLISQHLYFIVTGADEEDVKYRMSGHGVIFLPSQQPDGIELFSSVKQGLR